ncbi:formate dehydrogenase subunit gamma [Paucibacter sp. B2R-40]|uniref:formate dehydrogenase subunit gamma n=1 Tax=Paucibacter sp. B2R-40 TaxID=2893554 RepID=UPI0021E3BE6C|nr:formate dehydrogenase subunit gamma [Paucibacter sp. B2R-40]MCV2354246.1 formate dehydrogenase subunit gamma [Paucibacter sp. B2R-40]
MRNFFASLLALLTLSVACAQAAPDSAASAAAAVAPPAGFVAPALPKADDSNAQRAKSQPGNNAPFWRAVHGSGDHAGTSNLPGAEKGVLIQSMIQYPGSKLTTAGEAWRQVRNQWIIPYGGSLLLITVLALALFYFSKGTLGGHVPYTGRLIERFTYFERAAHWSNAAAFSLLAISGLVMAFGKFFLLPVLGATLFGWLTYALKTAHNLAGPLFAVSLLVVFMTFVRDNLPTVHDLKWMLKGGGLFGEHEVPSARFNAGEKVVFWGGVFLLGFTVVGSGLVLDQLLPGLAYLRGDMQIAHMIHAVAAMLMMVLFLGHIYMGTVGMKDALKAMQTGMVDEGWAKEHHELWFDDIRAGNIPAQRSTPVDQSRPANPAAQH